MTAMEGYYNHLFQQSARRSSAIDRLTDPGNVTNYLCGYSLRICTLYLLWIHLVFNISLMFVLILATTYITIRFEVVQAPNATLYTVMANNKSLFAVDMYTKGLGTDMVFVGNKVAQVFFSCIFLDMTTTVMALIGVYLNKLLLMVPYVVPIFVNILWWVILILIEGILIVMNRTAWRWIGAGVIVLLLTKDFYRFVVLYSYFHLIGRHCYSTPRTPQYLTTDAPAADSPVMLATTEAITTPSSSSEKDSEDES